MSGAPNENKEINKFVYPKHGAAFSRFGFGRIAPCNSPDSFKNNNNTKTTRSTPSPSRMLAACRGRGYTSSAVEDILGSTAAAAVPRRKFTDETVSSSLRLEKESCSSEPPISRSNSLINPVALQLLHQADDEMNYTPSPPVAMGSPVDEEMHVNGTDRSPPPVHANPPMCCRPRAIRPPSS